VAVAEAAAVVAEAVAAEVAAVDDVNNQPEQQS